MSNRACIATSARKLPPWQSPLRMCSRCPRNAMPIMSSVITMCMVRTPKQRLSPEGRLCRDCLFLDAINAVPRLPLHRCDGRIKVRLRFLVSFDLHFFFRLPGTPLAHTICIADGSPNKQQLWKFGLFVGGEKQSHCMPFDFHSPIMCMVVIFRENSPVAILAAASKRSFWATWTVMKNCRSQFAWPRAQLK